MTNVNQPPHSIESERAVLASILKHGKTEQIVRECLDNLTPEMFYFASNRDIYQAALDLPVVDFILVSNELKKRAETGGYPFDMRDVVNLKDNYTALKNMKVHADIVATRANQRGLIAIANQVSELAFSKTEPQEIIDYMVEQISEQQTNSAYEVTYIQDLLKDYVVELQERSQGEERYQGLKTGISGIDREIGGIGSTWLFVLAGRPSMGKSLVAQIIANHISRTAPTIFFSMEMSENEILDRFFGLEANISAHEIRTGLMTEVGYHRIGEVMADAKNGKYKQAIDTTPGLSLAQVRARAKAWKKQNPDAGLIQIDYLGLMATDSAERNDLALAKVTKGLKQLAKEIQVPIMLLVQCARTADTARRLTMSHLADSASIERDADLVMFTNRPEVNDPETAMKGVIELTCGKFRHGNFANDVYLKNEGGGYICLDKSQVDFEAPTHTRRKGFDCE